MTRWLIGMMGSGKSTVGRITAARLGMNFIDSDDLVEAMAGKTIGEIWDESGEPRFRVMESEAIASIEDSEDLLVSVGGGAPMDDGTAQRLRGAESVVWLHCSLDELARRIGVAEGRPLLSGADPVTTLEQLMAARVERYAALADARIDTTDASPEQVVDRLEALWTR